MLAAKWKTILGSVVLVSGLFAQSAVAVTPSNPPALPMTISGSVHTISGTAVTQGTVEAFLGTATNPVGTLAINSDGTFGGLGLQTQLSISGTEDDANLPVQFKVVTSANPVGYAASATPAVAFSSGEVLSDVVLTVPDAAAQASGGGGGGGSTGGGAGGDSGSSADSGNTPTATSVQQTVDTGTAAVTVATADNSVKLTLPQGTFDQKTTLQVNRVTDAPQAPTVAEQVAPAWSFDANGQTLNKPVQVTFQLNQSTDGIGLLAVYTLVDGKWQFVELAQADAQSGTATASLPHFSVWTVMQITTTFPDVASSSWAYDSIEELVARQAVSGYQNGRFGPSDFVTRGQFVRMLDVALNLKTSQPDREPFADVQADAWYAPYVNTAYQNGILSGDQNGNVRPNSPITRQEAAAILARAIGNQGTVESSGLAFKDKGDIALWAQQAVAMDSANQLLSGYPDGTFAPLQDIRRDEAASLIVRLAHFKKS